MGNLVIHESINEIQAQAWNRWVVRGNPFVRHEFYSSLEGSNCLGEDRGWRPLYFCAYEGSILQAMAAVFVKTDSFGEYIFDWAWAQAYQQYQVPYYPKLTMASPFSPVSAPKVLGDPLIIQNDLLPKIWEFYQASNASGLHALFVQSDECQVFKDFGLVERDSFQYHWDRGETQSFEDYLSLLKRSRRKNIVKERRRVQQQGLLVEKVFGPDLKKDDLDFFYQCYRSTIQKKYAQAYLTREFFAKLIQTMDEQIVLLVAHYEDRRVASALFLISDDTLYGRYWGCLEEFDGLHFELCLYRGIDLVYELNLQTFEAGAQGEHKRARGFKPVLTKSFHHLKRPEFHRAVENFVEEERREIQALFDAFESMSAFKVL